MTRQNNTPLEGGASHTQLANHTTALCTDPQGSIQSYELLAFGGFTDP